MGTGWGVLMAEFVDEHMKPILCQHCDRPATTFRGLRARACDECLDAIREDKDDAEREERRRGQS